jgi:hypothetical protein
MNSHERRVTERRWPHCINVINDSDDYVNEVFDWLYINFGSCWFTRKNNPRWCFRPHHESVGNFVLNTVGAQIFFRKKEDYAWFMLRWDR